MQIRGNSDFDSVELSIALIACDSTKENNTCKYDNGLEIKSALHKPEFVTLYNEISFDKRFFNKDDYIIKKAKLLARHVDSSQNNYIDVQMKETMIQDET